MAREIRLTLHMADTRVNIRSRSSCIRPPFTAFDLNPCSAYDLSETTSGTVLLALLRMDVVLVQPQHCDCLTLQA